MNVKLIISVFVGVFFSRKKNEIDRHSPKIICRQALSAKHDTQNASHVDMEMAKTQNKTHAKIERGN